MLGRGFECGGLPRVFLVFGRCAGGSKIRDLVSHGRACRVNYGAGLCGDYQDGYAGARLVAGSWGDSGPLFGVDVNKLAADETAVIDESTFGAPVHSLRDIPAGDYFVQAILNIYTEFHRADGHRVWLH